MILMSDGQFKLWKSQKAINEDDILISTPNSYCGLNLRGRPGAFIIRPRELVHWSYSPKDCMWVIFEKETKVVIQFEEIESLYFSSVTLFWKLFFLFPRGCIVIRTKDGEVFEILLYKALEDIKRVIETSVLGHKIV